VWRAPRITGVAVLALVYAPFGLAGAVLAYYAARVIVLLFAQIDAIVSGAGAIFSMFLPVQFRGWPSNCKLLLSASVRIEREDRCAWSGAIS
jgi:hypothetical protein